MRFPYFKKGTTLYVNYVDCDTKQNILLKGIVDSDCYISLDGRYNVCTSVILDTEVGKKVLNVTIKKDLTQPLSADVTLTTSVTNWCKYIPTAKIYKSIADYRDGVEYKLVTRYTESCRFDNRGYAQGAPLKFDYGRFTTLHFFKVEESKVEDGMLVVVLLRYDAQKKMLIPADCEESSKRWDYWDYSLIGTFKVPRFAHRCEAEKYLRDNVTIVGADYNGKKVEKAEPAKKSKKAQLKEWADKNGLALEELKTIIAEMD